VFSSNAAIEPGVFGAFHSVLLLPEGLAGALTPPQFDAIIDHELHHVRYRDNLTAALHMCVETVFWFHPLVWWIGAYAIIFGVALLIAAFKLRAKFQQSPLGKLT